jgi:phosphohistidine phosphatase SixA
MEANEKFIVLLRHGIAEAHGARENDDERVLTATGERRMKQIGRGLAKLFPKAEVIYASPLIRCVQTAKWVLKAYGSPTMMRTTDALKPGTSTDDIRALITTSEARHIICAGHEPSLSAAMLALTNMSSDGAIELRKGGCYGVRLLADGSARLEWMLRPRILRRR